MIQEISKKIRKKPELIQLMSSLLAIVPLQVRKSDLLIEQAAIPLLKMVLKNR
jgi:hypothetical protein